MAILVATITLIGTIMAPLFGDTAEWGIVLSRFNAGWWGILLGIILMGVIIIWAMRIDRERDDNLKELIKQAMREYNGTK